MTELSHDVPAADIQGGLRQGMAEVIEDFEKIRNQSKRIESAIRKEAFKLVYQPICDIRTRKVHHYEALIRPDKDLPPSYRFVRLAEEAGISDYLDLAVLKRAIAVAKRQARVAVNISGHSVQKPDFQKSFVEIIKDHSKNIILELTETSEIKDLRTVNCFFEYLKSIGVSICLDDFGSGYAGFQYIKNFNFDFIKIDGSYVQSAPICTKHRDLLYSIMGMAQAIGARTIAEFVETEEQARLVESIGGQLIQGWLVGKPADRVYGMS